MTPGQANAYQDLELAITEIPDSRIHEAGSWRIRSGSSRSDLSGSAVAIEPGSGTAEVKRALKGISEAAFGSGDRVVHLSLLDGSGSQIWSVQRSAPIDVELTSDREPIARAPIGSRAPHQGSMGAHEAYTAATLANRQQVTIHDLLTSTRASELNLMDRYLDAELGRIKAEAMLEIHLNTDSKGSALDVIDKIMPQIVGIIQDRRLSKQALTQFIKTNPETIPGLCRAIWEIPEAKEVLLSLIISEAETEAETEAPKEANNV